MAKPRNSVLYLFDPLQQSPSTPRRDSSPELGASDKENDFSAGDVTMFFNRMYAAPKAQDARPHTPKGQLIDFGDTPVQGMLWDDTVHDGSDADEEQSENEGEGLVAALVHPRTPLADLNVEDTPRPLQDSRRPLQAPAFAATTSLSPKEQPLRALLAAPQGSPFAEVINSITFSALSIAEDAATTAEQSPLSRKEVSEDGRVPSPFPEITICAPETPSVPDFHFEHNEEPSETPATSQSRLRPTSALTQLSPDDPRRTSVDLHSSFHLHMQSDDMSFDLLNDKISFLGNAQDSFWAGGDDTMFDFDEENCVPATKNIKSRLASVEEQPMEEARRVFSPPKVAIEVVVANSPVTTAMQVPLPMSPPPSTPRFDSPRILAEHVAMPPSPPTSPVSPDEPSLMMELEPLPPPVPALRIMKKTFKMTGRIYSTPPAAETLDPIPARQPVEKLDPAAKRSSPMAAASPAVAASATISAPQPQHPRPNYRGVQRPPASMLAAGVVIGLPPQGSSHNTSTSTSSSSSAGSSASRATRPQDGSRFAAAGIQRPALPSKERSVPRSATAVPARQVKAPSSISRAASASAAVLRSAVGASGLRPPSRIGAPGSGAGSTLPRPASRLPGPSASGLARTASTGTTSGIGRPRSVTAPRVPTGGRF
ncbi:hypothetical protein TRAPUB_2505 [Trametes pubescens]|uniref:Uncharacterized protein n=1 Tax=Trametes pubescens TaxID=154538 RepID=A0A1M2VGG7_TRAPU|nr:hypothetical protein TRAPUB_2505 [Trametes pubescens]